MVLFGSQFLGQSKTLPEEMNLFKVLDILKRPQKFETISHLIWHLLSKRQIMWEIVSNFVAFLENLNFNMKNTGTWK